ncbi:MULTISPECIES: hypothetical protein [Priestia]|uniref:Uncharacterized protein n=1 Tax=Priestia megaterium Q3 TaxID=1452722 RepID=A0A806TRK6_PRIMG|nr:MULTISPECIES: hypothetical protein [Priestia]AKP78229.1 hypothetical protein AS52_03268 [Priestia megaterium Q3]MCM2975596.1 hypothetical protein [Priestia aryabhattai]MED3922114.1 hypothetical protein [Priestia aryabhattai]MED3948257.1 hypothetical protein [Priestia aryabhattai]MED3957911.1 hypothetical protein [Priestia aryabhattai]
MGDVIQSQLNIFSSQSQSVQSLTYGSETSILTVNAETKKNNQKMKIDGFATIEANIPLGLTSYQYGVTLRVYRNSQLLFSQNLQQGAAAVLTLSFTQQNALSFTWVDTVASIGTYTYSVRMEFFVRSSTGVSVQTTTRAIAITT